MDIWSLGCIIGEMYMRKPIFPGTDTLSQIEKIIQYIVLPTMEDLKSIQSDYTNDIVLRTFKKIRDGKIEKKDLYFDLAQKKCPDNCLELLKRIFLFNSSSGSQQRANCNGLLKYHWVDTWSGKWERSRKIIYPKLLGERVKLQINDDEKIDVKGYRERIYHDIRKRRTYMQQRKKEIDEIKRNQTVIGAGDAVEKAKANIPVQPAAQTIEASKSQPNVLKATKSQNLKSQNQSQQSQHPTKQTYQKSYTQIYESRRAKSAQAHQPVIAKSKYNTNFNTVLENNVANQFSQQDHSNQYKIYNPNAGQMNVAQHNQLNAQHQNGTTTHNTRSRNQSNPQRQLAHEFDDNYNHRNLARNYNRAKSNLSNINMVQTDLNSTVIGAPSEVSLPASHSQGHQAHPFQQPNWNASTNIHYSNNNNSRYSSNGNYTSQHNNYYNSNFHPAAGVNQNNHSFHGGLTGTNFGSNGASSHGLEVQGKFVNLNLNGEGFGTAQNMVSNSQPTQNKNRSQRPASHHHSHQRHSFGYSNVQVHKNNLGNNVNVGSKKMFHGNTASNMHMNTHDEVKGGRVV